jgi:hypothetical protein
MQALLKSATARSTLRFSAASSLSESSNEAFDVSGLRFRSGDAQNTPIRVVTSECPRRAHQPIPLFRDGYCIKNDGGSARAWGPDGRAAFAIVPRLPHDEPLDITDIAVNRGAGFVLAVFSTSGSGLVLLDEDGIQRKFIPTGYKPAHLAISEDHSIWVGGSSNHQSTDHMLIHKYSASGEQIGAYLPFSSFPAGTVEPLMYGPDTTILVGGGVVVVTARSGAAPTPMRACVS